MTDPDIPPAVPPPPAGPGHSAPTVSKSNARLAGPVGVVIAGLLVVIGALLPWVSITVSAGGVSQSVESSSSLGPNGSGSWPTVVGILGAIILICGSGYLFGTRNRVLLGIAAAFSPAALGIAVYRIVDIYHQAQQVYQQMDNLTASLPAPAQAGFPGSFRDIFHIGPASGLWLIAVASLLGTVFAVYVLVRPREGKVFGTPSAQPGPQWPTYLVTPSVPSTPSIPTTPSIPSTSTTPSIPSTTTPSDPTASAWPNPEPPPLRPATPTEPDSPDRPAQP